MDVAIGDHLGTMTHQRQHHEIAPARIDLLARAQRLVEHHHRRRRKLHLADALGEQRHCGFARARRIGCLGETRGCGGHHLLGAAAARGHRHQVVAAQQRDQRGKVDRFVGLAHAPQVDGHRILVEQTRRDRLTFGQILCQHGEIRTAQHQRHHGERRALQLEQRCVLRGGGGSGHAAPSVQKVTILSIGSCTRSP
jgi:hypothetical protein